MTLNGVMAVILRYFSQFEYLPGALRKSSRSLSHLLMSSCFITQNADTLKWWQFLFANILLYPQHRCDLNECFLGYRKHLQASRRFLGTGALECTGLSKCKQKFAEQLTSSGQTPGYDQPEISHTGVV